MYLLYSAVLALAVVLSAPWWLVQMARAGKYRAGLAERLGRLPSRIDKPHSGPVFWIHAVSVGEALAISGLVAALRARVPNARVVVSTTTQTGQKLARERFGADDVFYFPLDFAFAIRPYLSALRPSVVVLAETEFWPNFLRLARESGARVAVVNARISDRSLPRYKQVRALLSHVLRNVDTFLAQSDEDRRRLIAIGAAADRVHFAGNLKFDATPPAEVPFVAELREAIRRAECGPVIVAGSTVEGEEPLVVDAFRKVRARYPRALLVIAVRHKERFDAVAALLASTGIPLSRRSRDGASNIRGGAILLLDSIGELASVYSLADLAFVGGSLVPRGGHNILEPVYYAVPTVVGPHTENFRDIITQFSRENAVFIANSEDLGENLLRILGDENGRLTQAERATRVLHSQRGATGRTVDALVHLMEGR